VSEVVVVETGVGKVVESKVWAMSRSILDVGDEVSVTIGTCLLDLASYTVVRVFSFS
jgi:hypothetical protein